MSIVKTITSIRLFGLFTSLALLSLSSQVYATSDLEQGLQFQSNGDLVSAENHFQVAAQAGSSEAQYQLGLLYVKGIGIDSSFVNAEILIQKAADQGHVLATEWLGLQAVSQAPSVEEEEDPEDDC